MALKPLYLWLLLINLWTAMPWSFGPIAFVCLGATVAMLWLYYYRQIPTNPITILDTKIVGLLLTLATTASLYCIYFGFFSNTDTIIDIGQNTYAAVEAFIKGNNPYTEQTQLSVKHLDISQDHISIVNGQTTLFGIPYYYGYPYFPMMLLAYTPFYFVADHYQALRLTQLVLVCLTLVGFWLFACHKARNKKEQLLLFVIACLAYLGILRYPVEAFILGVTDILLGTLLLYCLLAIAKQRIFIAGLILGCCQAAKLLPAPLAYLGIMYFLWLSPQYKLSHMGIFTLGFLLTSLLIILPFVWMDSEGFISATLLYYLTHHQNGDITSLWFFMPTVIQACFLAMAPLLCLVTLFAFIRQTKKTITSDDNGLMLGIFSSYLIFIIFSKMSHINYAWGVFPLGCMGLSLLMTSLQKSSADA